MASAIKGVTGTLPEFGAIFMSNMKTKEECFSRKLFGLPLAFSEFVKNVRVGMVLFLFEYEHRKLYGVFEAVSDGGINVVPYAYHASGKSFPAQVQFRVIWRCYPLPEYEFRDAISENYYAAYKFNFGLSENQVRRLLCLFDTRRVNIQKSLLGKKIWHRDLKASKFENTSVDSDKLSGQNENYRFRSEPHWSLNAEKSTCPSSTASKMNNCITGQSVMENLSLSGNQPSQLLEETELVDTSSGASLDLGDFIPLSSPDNCKLFKETEHVDTCSGASSDLGDFIPLTSPDNDKTMDIEVASEKSNLDGSAALDTSYQHYPEYYPKLKGLYADALDKRTSVFSRLELNAECAAHGKESFCETLQRDEIVFPNKNLNLAKESRRSLAEDESGEMIMEHLLQRQKNWMKKIEKDSSNVIPQRVVAERGSVFSRLKLNPEFAKQEKDVSTFVFRGKSSSNANADTMANELIDGASEMSEATKKRGHEVCNKDSGHGVKSCPTIQVKMLKKAYGFAESTKSMPHWRRLGEEKPFLNIKPEPEIGNKNEGKGSNYIGVRNSSSENQQKKRKLVLPTQST